ncbi:bifunctional hydroxymethylpyrimidine kinase/phosphomethylpyrimidine kinase [Nitrincola tapanii]|jgi:hydroxymethylpyrimidine/phosphomethylpyrimidine kinase|uniref:hydroxymethylpyrimidine kinase n=1 Tax=Nitrincola tapanii TaxID=1708751 RepID=A0A5A9W0I3_9GAMM|nr:bifunctional hydroxymethylpyrimidine kinase/phosphomethylpyrimidine kinase [Nitrincola tapanii]KAA0873635.1 bifunctional hydroxymethylpyrimidine kinase/phosphomethylpyrimidine kinase [Nitrincola tapanii]
MSAAKPATPIALTLAGSDSGGGAGIQADLKTFSALGVYGASVITALTAQNTREVRAIHYPPLDFLKIQIATVLDDLAVTAIKTGMLGTAELIYTVVDALSPQANTIPWVVDPVMIAKSGDSLLQADAITALREALIPRATLITPNLPEAARLCQQPHPESLSDMYRLLDSLSQLGAEGVLLKGGHLDSSDICYDLLRWQGQTYELTSPRFTTGNTHGTGCTLASAIAAGLAKGWALPDAVAAAKDYISQAIAAADQLSIGQGHGPVHHFYASWPKLTQTPQTPPLSVKQDLHP